MQHETTEEWLSWKISTIRHRRGFFSPHKGTLYLPFGGSPLGFIFQFYIVASSSRFPPEKNRTLTFHLLAKEAPKGSRLLSSKVGPSSTTHYKYLPKSVLLSCVRTLGYRWSFHSRIQTLKFCNLCLGILLLHKPNAPSNIENTKLQSDDENNSKWSLISLEYLRACLYSFRMK